MSFFEPPAPPPEPPECERHRPPEWVGPPDDLLGSPVPTRLVIARAPGVVVAVSHVVAFTTGVEFELLIRFRKPEVGRQLEQARHAHLSGAVSGELPDDLFRFGVLYSDGRKATSLMPFYLGSSDEPPAEPVLNPRGGSGSDSYWHQRYWLWPLPPQGQLTFVCEWPAMEIAETRTMTGTASILAAAQDTIPLWDDTPIA